MSDPLEQLLRDADRLTPSIGAPDELPQRVRQKLTDQRRATKLIGSVTIALIVIIAAGLVIPKLRTMDRHQSQLAGQPRRLNINPPHPSIDSAKLSIAKLDFDAYLHQRIADELLSSESIRRHRAVLSSHDPTLAMLQQQRDRAALLLVYQADQYRKQNEPRRAIAAYQRTIELFPQSHWAAVARQRLKQTQAGA